MLAASDAVDIGRLLLDLLIVLVAAKLAAELAERIQVPAVLGEICAGIVIGPSGFGLIKLTGGRGVSLSLLAEVGVLLLLLTVGMEMDLVELGKVGRASTLVAVVGVIVPFAAGTVVGLAFGESTNTAIFFGAALTATSVGITARVFGDLRALATIEARIVLGAAVADDVLGLVILTVVVKVVTGGSVGIGTVASTLGLAVLFLVGSGIVGLLIVPRVLDVVHRRASPSALIVAAIGITLGFATLADLAKLAFIIGAFMAGLGLRKSTQHERIARDLDAVGQVFIPIFFVQIGVNADLGAMGKPAVLGLAAVMSVLAIAGKLVAAVGAAGTRSDKLLIGLGMIPRGEVGLIFASIGLSNGVLDTDQYGALLLVVLVSTLVTPPLLRLRLGHTASSAPAEEDVTVEPPDGGWIEIVDDEVTLRVRPPASETVPIALETALLAADHRPASALLDWFAAHRDRPLQWDPDDTPALVTLLRADQPRAWRFLEATGVLERALPEVATAMQRRRSDLSDLDPLAMLRFPTVDRLHDLYMAEDPELLRLDQTEELVIAALASDVADDPSEVFAFARRLVPDTDAERITSIANDARMLRAEISDLAALSEREVLELATHLASPAHAQTAYVLALALGPLAPHQRERLREQQRLVHEALDHPELTGSDATNLASSRRIAAQRMLDDEAAIERLRHASVGYLLSHEPEELARQARLVEPLARAGVVRAAVSPEPEPDHWKVDLACRDSPGLLARLTEVLTDAGADIVCADIATWPDGAVLDSFIVHSATRPSPRTIAEAAERRLRGPLRVTPLVDIELTFDNDALPWHTRCVATGPDQPGVLQALSAAFAAADVVVHSARIQTLDDRIGDRFALSDRLGRKLDQGAMDRIRRTLRGERVRHRGRRT